MAIAFKCPKCQKPYKVKDDMAGKMVTCVGCKKPMRVPAPTARAATDHPEADEMALAALADEPVPVATAEAPADGTFQAECPNCMEPVAFPLKMAGKQAPCPSCRRIVRVPQPADDRKKDWRAAAIKPEAARIDKEHMDGAWGNATHTSIVGRDALLEAAVIKSRKDRELTTRQKLTRLFIPVAALALCAVGFQIWRGQKSVKVRDDYMKRAEALLAATPDDGGEEDTEPKPTTKADVPPFVRAEVARAAAEYYLRSQPPNLELAERRIKAATYPIPQEPDKAIERALMVGETALAACDLGGTEKQARDGTRLRWDAAQTPLQQVYLQMRGDGPGREGAMLAIARGAAKLGAATEDRPDGFKLALGAYGAGDPRDLSEALAAAGLELLAAGDTVRPRVEEMADRAAAASPQPSARLVALLVALKKPVPSVPMPAGGEPQTVARLGYAEGLARSGDADTARRVAAMPGRFDDRFAALVAVAAATGKVEDAQACLELLEKDLGGRDLPEWPVIRLAQICAELKESGPGQALAAYLTKLSPATAKQQAVRAWAIALQMRAGHAPCDEAAVKALPAQTAGAQLAWQTLARQAAASGHPLDVSGWPAAVQPLGLAGTALGLLDRK